MAKSMKNHTNSEFMYFLNMIVFGIGLANSCYMSILMNSEIKYSWLIPLFLILPFIILILFIKKDYQSYNQIKKKFITKFLLFCYSTLSISILIYYTSVILNNWFYEESSLFLLIVIFGFILSLLGLLPKNTILRIGFLWGIAYLLIATIGISIHNESNIMFLFPIELKISTFVNNLFFLIIPLDNIIYFLFEEKHNPQRKTIMISGILALAFCTIQLIINLTLVNYRFYEDLETPAIEVFFMYFSKNHIGHYDIVLIVNILMTLFYKGVLYSNLTLELFPKNKRKFLVPFISLLIIPLSIFLIFNKSLKYYYSYIILGFLLLIYLLVIIYQRSKLLNDK